MLTEGSVADKAFVSIFVTFQHEKGQANYTQIVLNCLTHELCFYTFILNLLLEYAQNVLKHFLCVILLTHPF